jgi:hypothetical protein
MTYWLLPFTFQLVLQSIVLFPVYLIFGKPTGFKEGILLITWYEWFDRRWPFTTCILFLFGGSPFASENPVTWFHETGVHVKQYEEMAIIGDIIALGVYFATGDWITALVIWGTAGPLWMVPGFLTAARYRQAWKALGYKTWRGLYMFSWFERDAYAETEAFLRNGGGR